MLLLLLFVSCSCLRFFVSLGRPVGRSAGQPGIPPVNRATAPVSRSTGQPGISSPSRPIGRSAGQPGIPPVNRATAPVSRSTGQPPRSAGQPGNRATGQPGRGGVNRDPVSRLPGPVGRLPPYSEFGSLALLAFSLCGPAVPSCLGTALLAVLYVLPELMAKQGAPLDSCNHSRTVHPCFVAITRNL